MINKKVLEEYKQLSHYSKNNLYNFLVFKTCYNYDPYISDDVALRVFSLAEDCCKEYDSIDMEKYAEYILDAIYQYDGTIDEIEEKGAKRIVDLYDENVSPKELLVFDIDNLQYCFTTTNNEKYYTTEDGFIAVNEEGRKIKDPNPMDNDVEIFFDLLSEDKIKEISSNMHYNIRCVLKDDFGDEAFDFFGDGMLKYKKYCEKNHVTSRAISDAIGEKKDIDLFDIDKEYSVVSKLSKLQQTFEKVKMNDVENYVYVSTLTNGTDYYYDDKNGNNYIAIDKNGVYKELKNKPFFLLNELNNETDDFIYISKSELNRIKDNLKDDYENLRFLEKNFSMYQTRSLKKYWEYIKKHNIDIFKDNYGVKMMIENEILHYDRFNKKKQISDSLTESYNKKQEKEI